jgi:hypothetical protein
MGAETGEELSVEEVEKADIMPRSTTMPERLSTKVVELRFFGGLSVRKPPKFCAFRRSP